MKRLFFLILLGILISIFIWGFFKKNPLEHWVFEGFDTWIEIDLPSCHQSVVQTIKTMVENLDAKWDRFDQNSEIWKMNHRFEPIMVDDDTFDLFIRSQELEKKTNGYFSIKLGSLMDEWGFSSHPHVPSSHRIQILIEQVAGSGIILDEKTKSILREGSGTIDLGGIAKGYFVDMVVSELKKNQITPALINAGGTVYALGRTFRVGILHPRQESLIGIVEVKNQAVSTSGDYYRYFEQNGIRFYHILNPFSGYPSHEFSSVTVIYSKATDADAISTAIMAGGSNLIPIIEERFPGVAIIAIQSNGKMIMNDKAHQIFQKELMDSIRL